MDGLLQNGSVLSLSDKNDIIMQKHTLDGDSDFHTHSFIEIAYIAAGSGVHEIEDGYISHVEKGDLVLFNSDVSHAYRVGGGEKLVVYNCIFDPSVLSYAITKSDDFINIVYRCLFEGAKQSSVSKPYIVLSGADRVFPVIGEMYAEYEKKENGYEKVNAANLIKLLVLIFRLQMNEKEIGGGAYRSAIAESAVSYMNEYYPEKISCEMLASRAYLSAGYFHRIFKSVTGESPIAYLQNIRLKKAAELLCGSNMTVKQAAAAVGYSDMKHFYRIFYKKYGVTPKQYQNG